MRLSQLGGLSFYVLSASVAAAQPDPVAAPVPGDPAQPPPPVLSPAVPPPAGAAVMPVPPPEPQPEPVSTVDTGVLEDANSGRSWLMPTALTAPAGTWSFSDYELLAVGAGYSPTDQVSLSLSTLLPIVKDMPFVLFGTGKLQILKTGQVRIAAHGAFMHARVDDTSIDSMGNTTSSTASVTVGEVGGVLTYCIDVDCHSHVSGFLGAGFAYEDQSAVPFLFGGSLAYRVGKHIKLLVEADSGFVLGEVDAAADGFLLWYGVRFTSRMIGVDLAFVKPICDGCESDELPMGFPFVAFTYRSLGGS